MPFGKYSTAKRRGAASTIQAAARKRAFTKNRKGLRTVGRIQRKMFVPQRIKNTASISSLSTAVRRLQKSQIGPYQKRLEHVELDSADMGSDDFNFERPICFQMNDFTNDCKLHTTNLTTHNSMQLKGWTQMPSQFTGGLAKYDQFWATNDCEVSKLRYLPIKCDFKLTLSGRLSETDVPIWVRVDFLRPNRVLPSSGSHDLNLPSGLYSLAHQITTINDPVAVNDINPLYWRKVRKSKWLKLSPRAGNSSDRTIQAFSSFSIRFPSKVINVETDTPYSYANDSMLTNVPRNKQMWMVFHFDRVHIASEALKLGVQRTLHFRDEHGAAN
ncbi:MAG: putative capsid protein [Circoviridae sp.]|nr:MAG: putative capsid protein [Circoviridae sp.]